MEIAFKTTLYMKLCVCQRRGQGILVIFMVEERIIMWENNNKYSSVEKKSVLLNCAQYF